MYTIIKTIIKTIASISLILLGVACLIAISLTDSTVIYIIEFIGSIIFISSGIIIFLYDNIV